ncbi:hypothetical protein [Campylobacter rectus]
MTDFSLNLFAYSLNPHLYDVNFAKIRLTASEKEMQAVRCVNLDKGKI